jgi:hypothetical protein
MRRLALLCAVLVLSACAQEGQAPSGKGGFDASSLPAPAPSRPYQARSSPGRLAEPGSVVRASGSPLEADPRASTDAEFSASLSPDALARVPAPASVAGAAVRPPAAVSLSGAPGRTYAVIVNGDDDRRTGGNHRENVTLAFQYLSRRYGTAQGDVILLSPDRGAPATRGNVLAAAREAAARVKPGDRLVVYTTGHGTRSGNRWMLVLQGGQGMDRDEFVPAFLNNAASDIVYIGDQCFSGAFAASMAAGARQAGKGVISLSATDANNSSVCVGFIRPFFAAIDDPRSDEDRDGQVDEREAFIHARARYQASFRGSPELTNAQFHAYPRPVPSS